MVKYDIAALIRKLLAACLNRVFKYLVHARDIRAHRDDRREIIERALHRVIES